MTTLIGYARVSKADGSQVHDLQRDALVAAGGDPGHIYEDAASGRRDTRPGLDACIKALRRGDTLVVWKLDRLGRTMKGLVDRWLADRNFVTREEFEAVREMAAKAREENEALKARLDAEAPTTLRTPVAEAARAPVPVMR